MNSLSTEERFLIGNLMQEEDGSFQIGSDEKGYKNLNTQKLYDSLSRKFNINMIINNIIFYRHSINIFF